MHRAPAAPLTSEDEKIWWHVRRQLSRRWGLAPHAFIQDLAEHRDRWDADVMFLAQKIARCGPCAIELYGIAFRGWTLGVLSPRRFREIFQ